MMNEDIVFPHRLNVSCYRYKEPANFDDELRIETHLVGDDEGSNGVNFAIVRPC